MFFSITYMGKEYKLTTCNKIKINGLIFQQDTTAMREENVEKVIGKIDSHFKSWMRRNLSTIGKIQIVKTFGISQLIYLMQAMTLTDSNLKLVNSYLYKFIWNRHYLAAKAPERVKREIVNKPIKLGGYGMLDVMELDKSLKLRALGRLTKSNHPFLKLIKNKLEFKDFLNPVCKTDVEKLAVNGVALLKEDRLKQVKGATSSFKILNLIRESRVKNLLSDNSRNSILYYNLVLNRKFKVKDLNREDCRNLGRLVHDPELIEVISRASDLRNQAMNVADIDYYTYIKRGNLKHLSDLSSKEFRTLRRELDPECVFKIGVILDPMESINWCHKINSLSSTRHKNNILKVIHGDVYSKERKFRFGLTDTPLCDRCGDTETITHKLFDCPSIKTLWEAVFRITNTAMPVTPNCEHLYKALGAFRNCSTEVLTIHAEALTRLLYLKPDDTLLPPNTFIRLIITSLMKKEKSRVTKQVLENLLEHVEP